MKRNGRDLDEGGWADGCMKERLGILKKRDVKRASERSSLLSEDTKTNQRKVETKGMLIGKRKLDLR